jgi:hypothetical protein
MIKIKVNFNEVEIKCEKISMFQLNISDIKSIDDKYGLPLTTNLSTFESKKNVTLTKALIKETSNFFDIDNRKRILSVVSKKPKTNIRCFWCKLPFDSLPVPCPLKLTKDGKFVIENSFCSFECCKAYIIDNSRFIKYRESLSLLHLLYATINNIKDFSTIKINIAPHWSLLDEFGGPMSIEEFRNYTSSMLIHETYNQITVEAIALKSIYEQTDNLLWR